jgi:hypothetical protein
LSGVIFVKILLCTTGKGEIKGENWLLSTRVLAANIFQESSGFSDKDSKGLSCFFLNIFLVILITS